MSANGQLTASELTRVSAQEQLSKTTAIAYENMVAAGPAKRIAISISSPGGGYRDLETQKEMREGSQGNVALARKWDLNPNSSVPLASPGYSTHGTGTRVDLLFNGSSSPTASQIAFAGTFGFTREFGEADPNHFEHDGKTAITPIKKDPDMVSAEGSFTYIPKKPIALSATDWTTLPFNENGDYSFVADYDGFVHVDIAFLLTGLAVGKTVQARLQVLNYNAEGKVDAVTYTDTIELFGSEGKAYPAFSDGVSIHKNQRLRLVVWSQGQTVSVERIGATVFRFQRS